MTGRYPTYTNYKDSKTDWYGEIPSHWAPLRIKLLIDKVSSGTSVNAVDTPAAEGRRGVLKTSCVYDGTFRPDENKAVVEDEINRVSCPVVKDRLIVSRMNTPDLVGAAGLVRSDYPNLFLPDRLWQIAFRNAAPDFVHYWTRTKAYRSQVRMACTGTSSSMQNLSQDQFGNFELITPPIEEQRSITAFLDYETDKTDTLIEKQQQLIKLLKEKRQAVISHAVTKGLNPDAPMKDSGVEWLGEVPEHWTVKRLKHISSKIGVGLVINPSHYVQDEGVHFLFGGDILEYGFKLKKTRKMSDVNSRKLSQSRLKENDLVCVRVGYPGVTAVIPKELEGSNCASMMVIRRGDFDSQWLSYCLNSDLGKNQVERVQYGAAQKQYNIADAIEFRFPVPPKDEQVEISSYLDAQRKNFSSLIRHAERAIKLLLERRTALISAAVTGKIDVRNWKPQFSADMLQKTTTEPVATPATPATH